MAPFAKRQHRRNTLPAGFVLNQKDRVAGSILSQIPCQSSRDAVLPAARRGADLQSYSLSLEIGLLRRVRGQLKNA